MPEILKNKKIISVLAISVLNGVAWWFIINYLSLLLRPYDSWVYNVITIYAVPVAMIIFITWFNFMVKYRFAKRLLVNFVILLYCIIMFYFLRISFYFNYNAGPSAFVMYIQNPGFLYTFYRLLMFLIIPAFPCGVYLILRISGKKVTAKYFLASVAGFILSFPLMSLLMHGEFLNLIEIVTSGGLISLLTFFTGIQVAGIKKIE